MPAKINEWGDIFGPTVAFVLDPDNVDDRESAVLIHQNDALVDAWSHCPTR